MLGKWLLMSSIRMLLTKLFCSFLLINTLSIKVALFCITLVGLVMVSIRSESRLNSRKDWVLGCFSLFKKSKL